MEGKIGLTEILFIVAIALLLFGPSKFAALGKSLGEGIRNFKSAVKTDDDAKKDKDEEKKS
jgi:sec-independent protein translocase protein TatA